MRVRVSIRGMLPACLVVVLVRWSDKSCKTFKPYLFQDLGNATMRSRYRIQTLLVEESLSKIRFRLGSTCLLGHNSL